MFWDKIKALLAALPAQLAAVQSVLTVVAAWLAVAAGWVAAAVRVVSRVTPVPAGVRGLVVPEGRQLVVSDTRLGDASAVRESIISAQPFVGSLMWVYQHRSGVPVLGNVLYRRRRRALAKRGADPRLNGQHG